jgi:hypothetical protein
VFARHVLSRCQYLKLDCEGAEYDILFHASADTLARIDHICLEYHDAITPHAHPELVALLARHGFTVRTYPNPVHAEIGLLYATR